MRIDYMSFGNKKLDPDKYPCELLYRISGICKKLLW